MASFPNEHVPYGVFAAPSPAALATGYAHTDDEDDNNHSYTGSKVTSNLNLLFRFANIIYGTENGTPLGQKNTNLLVAKVANNSCAPNQNACPFHRIIRRGQLLRRQRACRNPGLYLVD